MYVPCCGCPGHCATAGDVTGIGTFVLGAGGAASYGCRCWMTGFSSLSGCELGEIRPPVFGGLFSSCVMRVCRFNKSRRVNAAPQKQVNGFSLVSRINQPRHPLGHINAAYECERDAPDAPSSERSDRNARRHGALPRRWSDEPRGYYGMTAAASRHWRVPM